MSELTKVDDGWRDFVFTHFKESELVDDNPTCSGLRRVCEKIYGKILLCRTDVLRVPNDQDRSVTVVCTIKCLEYGDAQNIVIQSASADVSVENTVAPYNLHPVATAETRAEGRALRKLLNLDCTTYEELTSENSHGKADRIYETHARSIRNLCDNLKLDLNKFLAKEAGVQDDSLNKGPNALPKTIAEQLLSKLSAYRSGEEIPDDIKST